VMVPLLLVSVNYSTDWAPPIEILSPYDGETIGHNPTFEWTELNGAESYSVYVYDADTGLEVLVRRVMGSTYTAVEYIEDGVYIWFVDYERDGIIHSGSDPMVFFVGESTINQHFEWEYDGDWYWDMRIDYMDYRHYSDLLRTYQYTSYMMDDDGYIESLAQELKDIAEEQGWGPYQLVSFTLAFVQSLEYTSDLVTTGYDEYPRYPLETLGDAGGDCEDTSILFASLIEAEPIGIDAVLLLLPGHMAVGVAGDESMYGTYFEYQGRDYFYCETTGAGWAMGIIPDVYADATATVLQV